MKVSQLPLPCLEVCRFDTLHIVTDNALARSKGVRVAFTGRAGGFSTGDFAGLNLGSHVGDDISAVKRNRRLLLETLGASECELVVPNQVHGDNLVEILDGSSASVDCMREEALRGADGVLVGVADVAALLCFADCVPVIVVSPTGAFAVVHAGWRGTVARIASKAVRALADLDMSAHAPAFSGFEEALAAYNVYLGPYIHASCFETGSEVTEQFAEEFGESCLLDARHVDLGSALRIDLESVGVSSERIVEVGACTVCKKGTYYSYRAEGGVCGRHGAIAFRKAM